MMFIWCQKIRTLYIQSVHENSWKKMHYEKLCMDITYFLHQKSLHLLQFCELFKIPSYVMILYVHLFSTNNPCRLHFKETIVQICSHVQ